MEIRTIIAPNPGPFTLDGTHTYLIGNDTVIDPGPPIEAHIAAVREAMPRLSQILITHRHDDHAPAAIVLKQVTGARILAPHGVLGDDDVDCRLADGDVVDVDGGTLRVIATPGHTREHVCFLSDAGDLFSGDTVLGEGTTTIFPPDGHMGDYMRSLQRLRDAAPRRVYPAHGPIHDDAMPLIDGYIAHRLSREAQIVEALRGGIHRVQQIREALYPALDPRLELAADIQIAAHLAKLCEEERVVIAGEEFRLRG